jgi:DNA-directed RNA polymerase subunit RPC12/RpoP
MLLEHDRELRAHFRHILEPPPNLSVSEWAEQNVVIPIGRETYHGPVDFADAPYVREPLDCYRDLSVRVLTTVWGTQCLKTTMQRCGTMWRVVNRPAPCLWLLPNEKMVATPFSKNRWQPWLLECKATSALLPRTKSGLVDRKSFSTLEQTFTNGMPILFRGSHSAANVASTPIVLLNLDEIDKYQLESEFEPGALENVKERVKNAKFSLTVQSSTPTLAEIGIWREFLFSDQRYFEVPCPRCERRIVLRFRVDTKEHGMCGLRWYEKDEQEVKFADGRWDLKAVAQAAHYKCQLCGEAIHNIERRPMIRAGIWRPHNPQAKSDHRGYHLSSMYSLISDECTFQALAATWCEKQKDRQERRKFVNSTLAEPWNMQQAFDEDRIKRSEYEILSTQITPGRERYMTVDFQLNHFWVVIREWAPITPEHPFGESWVLFADRVETKQDVEEYRKQYGVPKAESFLDCAGRMNPAGQIINEFGWLGMMGAQPPSKFFNHRVDQFRTVQRVYSETEYRDAHQGSRQQNRSPLNEFPFIKWSKDPIREHLKGLMAKTIGQGTPIWHTHANVHPDYQRHMNAHVMERRHNGRIWQTFWRELPGVPDHLWDCECMNAVRAVMKGMCPLIDVRAEQPELFH